MAISPYSPNGCTPALTETGSVTRMYFDPNDLPTRAPVIRAVVIFRLFGSPFRLYAAKHESGVTVDEWLVAILRREITQQFLVTTG